MVCGSEQATNSGKTFLSYQGKSPHSLSLSEISHCIAGIPFAAPPVGDLRLKRPQAVEPWQGVLEVAGRPSVICPQFNYFQPGVIDGQEDCLYLNVYTPGNTSPPHLT